MDTKQNDVSLCAGARVSPGARCRLAADRMPFADDVSAMNSSATWRSSFQDGGLVTSSSGRVAPAAKLWSLPDARRARVVNALKGTTTTGWAKKPDCFSDLITL